jgi:DNA polymerase-3 subunit chi
MPQTDFYVLSETTQEASYKFICHFIHKAYQDSSMNKQWIYLYTATKEEADLLDAMLWTFQDTSFIPHCLASEADTISPIHIGEKPPNQPYQCLINLTDKAPDWIDHFTRVVEIVIQNDAALLVSREKYKEYQRRYREETPQLLHTHQLTKN